MTRHWIKQQAADVRVTWSRQERKRRAKASEKRCQQLLSLLVVPSDRRGARWATNNCPE